MAQLRDVGTYKDLTLAQCEEELHLLDTVRQEIKLRAKLVHERFDEMIAVETAKRKFDAMSAKERAAFLKLAQELKPEGIPSAEAVSPPATTPAADPHSG